MQQRLTHYFSYMAQAKKYNVSVIACGSLALVAGFILAAFRFTDDGITSPITQKLEKYIHMRFPEKVYVHLDKQDYVAGEDIWFKGYLVNGIYHTPTAISKNLYVELISPDGVIVNKHTLKVENGTTAGDFELSDSLETGTYQLRAYTNWMRNFPDAYFFRRSLNIYNDRSYTAPAIKARLARTKTAQLNATPQKPDFDVQFFPEGGNLVAGVTTRIGFKALNQFGLGEDISGSVLDASGKELTTFKSSHLGMGHFVFIPDKAQTLTARVKTASGRSLLVPFPEVQPSGLVMQVINFASGDLRVAVTQAATQPLSTKTLVLVAQMRGAIFYTASVKLSKKDVVFPIPASQVPGPGIAQLTLFDATTQEPLNERLIFVRPKQTLNLSIQPDKNQYKAREQVQLNITATDPTGAPVAGEFSLAVTDAALPGKNESGNLLTYLLLSSDLPGNIEQPAYYFDPKNTNAWQDLDNLMLTQGWRRFAWKEVLTETYPALKFIPEQGIIVSGQVNRLLVNKPLSNAEVLLVSSGRQGFIIQTQTDAAGRFAVGGLDFDSVRTLFVQAKNEKGKLNTTVNLDKFEAPPLQFLSPVPPADNNSVLTAAYIQKMKNQQKINDTYTFKNGERVLKEVQVTAKRLEAPERTRIYGAADNVIKMTDQNATYSSVLQAIQGRVAGVQVMGGGMDMRVSIRGGGEPLFLLDEMPVDVDLINSISPTDVETIEILKGPSAAIYGSRGSNGVIAVFTKRGGGITSSRPSSGTTTGKMVGYYKARDFFAPRYNVAQEAHNLPDLRATVYWNPSVKTDATGKATVSFYNADQVKGLKIMLEGTTPAGAVGSTSAQLSTR